MVYLLKVKSRGFLCSNSTVKLKAFLANEMFAFDLRLSLLSDALLSRWKGLTSVHEGHCSLMMPTVQLDRRRQQVPCPLPPLYIVAFSKVAASVVNAGVCILYSCAHTLTVAVRVIAV